MLWKRKKAQLDAGVIANGGLLNCKVKFKPQHNMDVMELVRILQYLGNPNPILPPTDVEFDLPIKDGKFPRSVARHFEVL